MAELTERQREILVVVIQLTDNRRVAETLGIAYSTLKNQLGEIKRRLNLDDRFVQFNELPIDDRFIHDRVRYKKIPYATDRYGRYNAQDGAGKRCLFQRTDIVERIVK